MAIWPTVPASFLLAQERGVFYLSDKGSLIVGVTIEVEGAFFHGDFKPSICSNKFPLIVAHMGSKMKSIPSRLANLAAGTK